MKRYRLYIKQFSRKKYKNSTVWSDDFLRKFYYFRNEKIKLIKNLNYEDNIDFKDKTFELLKKIYKKKSVDKRILILYRKFETNLALKKKYDKKFIKVSNNETSIGSYVYLGLLILKLKEINKFQKLNCVLKILDKVLYNNKSLLICNSNNLLKLLKSEKKLIKSLN